MLQTVQFHWSTLHLHKDKNNVLITAAQSNHQQLRLHWLKAKQKYDRKWQWGVAEIKVTYKHRPACVSSHTQSDKKQTLGQLVL